MKKYKIILAALPLLLASCTAGGPYMNASSRQEGGFVLTSPSFENLTDIPKRFTCDGDDFSPPLQWSNAPDGTLSFALIVDDPDAPGGNFVHWVLYNISGQENHLNQGLDPSQERLDNGAFQGMSSFHRLGYAGPCPPEGAEHKYYFTLYALSVEAVPNLGPRATKAQLLEAMQGNIVGQAQLTGMYRR